MVALCSEALVNNFEHVPGRGSLYGKGHGEPGLVGWGGGGGGGSTSEQVCTGSDCGHMGTFSLCEQMRLKILPLRHFGGRR